MIAWKTVTLFALSRVGGCATLLAAAFAALPVDAAWGLSSPTPEWIRQFGMSGNDVGRSVSADNLGNVFVSGYSEGDPLVVGLGGRDAILRKYDSAGNVSWTRQFGTNDHDASWGVEADGLGNVYVAGDTLGTIGAASFGSGDAFLRKYDSTGAVLWTSQFGTSGTEEGLKTSVDGLGSVYISGYTRGPLSGPFLGGDGDAFLRKYDASGVVLWTRQLGSGGTDIGEGLAADGLGNVFIGGRTDGSIAGSNAGSWDAFLAKYDSAGNQIWTRQFGTAQADQALCVAADGFGNAYVSGFTNGFPQQSDVFLSKYDSMGSLLWTRQVDSGQGDIAHEITVDTLGNVYLTGETSGPLGGPSAGDRDAFLIKYNPLGSVEWMRQIGTNSVDDGFGASTDELGNVYIAGRTGGSLGGPSGGGGDVFVVKFAVVPEPSGTAIAIALGSMIVSMRCRYGTRMSAASASKKCAP